MRPGIALAVIGTWAYQNMTGVPSAGLDSFAAAIGFYLFADRSLFYARKKMP
jgi:hypothetical protein